MNKLRSILGAAIVFGLLVCGPVAMSQWGQLYSGPAVAPSGITLVASGGGESGANSCTTSAMNNTGATLLVFSVTNFTTFSSTPTDSSSNSWSGQNLDVANGTVIWYLYSPTVSSSQTISFAQTGSFCAIVAMSFKGTSGSTVDQHTGANCAGTVTSIQSGSITPGSANEVVVTSAGTNGSAGISYAVDSGVTIPSGANIAPGAGTNVGGAIGYKVQTSAAAINPTWSWPGGSSVTAGSGPCAAVIASFK